MVTWFIAKQKKEEQQNKNNQKNVIYISFHVLPRVNFIFRKKDKKYNSIPGWLEQEE